MKKLLLTLIALTTITSTFAKGALSRDGEGDEWVGIGTGAYQPGILDRYSDEYPELLEASVYESSTQPGVYRFVPSPPSAGALVVYDIIVHAENPDHVWCENAYFFRGIMNFNTCHKVKETSSYDIPDNYGKLADGAIRFSTPNSFMVMEMMGYQTSNINGNFALYLPGSSPGDDPIVNDTWEVMGRGKYVEGLLDCEYEPGIVWDIDVERSVETPGCYRIKPYYAGNPSCPNLPEIADTYIYIHAEDEMEVYTNDFVLLNNQGRGYKIQHRAVLPNDPDPSYYGILEDGVITFPANSHYANIVGIPGAGRVLTNTSGRASIVLPGGKYEDYYIKAVHPACATGGNDGFCAFPFMLVGGADVANAVVAVEAGYKTADDVNLEAYISSGSSFPSMFFNFEFNMNFPVVAEQFNTNRWTMITLALDKKGKIRNTYFSTFFTPENDNEWEDYANAQYTDLILGPAYMALDETYPVLIQQKKSKPGLLRVVDPYLNHPVASQYMGDCTSHHHYLYVNATDPDYVYIEESPMGVNFGYGHVVASSAVGSLLNQGKTIDQIKEVATPAGKVEGDAIFFPARALYFFETEYKSFLLQDGDEGRLLNITEYLAGIEDVAIDSDTNSPVEYYDFSGIKMLNPVPGQAYIVKQGARTFKTFVK